MISAVWIVFAALAALIAVCDLTAYRIPNWATLSLMVLFLTVLLLHRAEVPWLDHAAAFGVCLALGILFFSFKQVGAGDAKLFAVAALWAGFGALIPLLFWIGIAGLAELAILQLLRRVLPLIRKGGALPRALMRKEGVPFGVGIAAGAVIASYWFPGWLWVA